MIGLGANAVAGWRWADPVAGLVIGAVAAREGVEAWRGHNCCGPALPDSGCCTEHTCVGGQSERGPSDRAW